ncbi:radical SAM family heme chaperone HemW [Reinekea sp.]|uniref:radical SAM family heme chaperone HemW n=1 Tax=Reinekea sp. TaxID=1970455 RepID=UPI003989865F
MNLLPPLSVYVHVPWCIRKCPYCDFNSHASKAEDIPEQAFIEQMIADIKQDAPLAQGRRISTVFFGGGTPSLLSDRAVGDIIEALNTYIGFEDDAEITLEANPGTAEADKFKGFARAGVNRLSIGVQSFDDSLLKVLGRIHNRDEAKRAAQFAHDAGLSNFNIDLMHGLPNQSQAQALSDIDQALALSPQHLSWYQLTIEANTEFYRAPPVLPEDDVLWAIQKAGQEHLAAQGFNQYEVSAYCKAGQESRHNLNYWRYGDYLGVGPGAHGKYTQISPQLGITRTRKTRLPKDYLRTDRLLVRHEEPVEIADRPFDYFINTLRLREPTSLIQFENLTGLSRDVIAPQLSALKAKGWLLESNGAIQTTDQGYLYLNDVLSHWLD